MSRGGEAEPLAFVKAGDPDVRDIQLVEVPAGIEVQPDEWATRMFDIANSPRMVRWLLGLREFLVPLIGVPRTEGNPFGVQEVVDGQALLGEDEPHLSYWVSVAQRDRELEAATAVKFHGWRGRLYWVPVGVLHGPIVRAMMRRAIADVKRDAPPATHHD